MLTCCVKQSCQKTNDTYLKVVSQRNNHTHLISTLLPLQFFVVFVETTNYFFTAVFVIEVTMRLIAVGYNRYLKDRQVAPRDWLLHARDA